MKTKTKKKEKKIITKKEKTADVAVQAVAVESSQSRTFQEIPLDQIRVNPLNPRKNFAGTKYDELLASVRVKGVIVPILVRPLLEFESNGFIYEIIAGERRFRAVNEVANGNDGVGDASQPMMELLLPVMMFSMRAICVILPYKIEV